MRLHPKRWSLATKWSLLLTALALGPLLAVISFSYQSATQKLLEQRVIALHSAAADGAASLDDSLGERIRQSKFLGTLPSLRELGAAPLGARGEAQAAVAADLKTLQSTYPYIKSLDLLDSGGGLLYSSSGRLSMPKDAAMLKTVTSGQVYTGLSLLSGVGEPGAGVVVATPLGGGNILRTESSPQFLLQRVARDDQRQATGALSLLLDSQGRVIARSDGNSAEAAVTLEDDGRLTLGDGQTYYAQSATLSTLPWKYVLALPEALLAKDLAEQKLRALLLALGVSAIIGSLARLLALSFTRPLARMAETTRALAAGDLTHSVAASPRLDEVGQLQNAFAEAYQQLRRLSARMRLSSLLVAEAADHLHTMAVQGEQVSVPVATASEKLSVVAKDLERQVSHFKV
jgi:HAMP domain-containing protein